MAFKTLVVKVTGLILAKGSGLNVGIVGPFVHISSMIAEQLSKVPRVFDSIRKSDVLLFCYYFAFRF